MAKVGEEEVEYDSDPEEGKRLLGMSRREAASDDEEGDGEEEEKRRVDRRAPIHSDDESDGQGGAAEYDDEYEEEEGLDEEEEMVYEDMEDEEEEGYEGEEGAGGYEEGKAEGSREQASSRVEVKEEGVEGRKVEENAEVREAGNHVEDGRDEEEEDGDDDGEEGKKENEPFAVPTAGAFYMHDDRFRDNAGGRNRRTYGGRKLWESKDEKRWGHDKFEEMTSQDRHYEQGRRASKGPYRTRGGNNRGPDRGYNRRGRPKPFSNGNNQNEALKGVKGRGPRRYEHMMKNISQTPPMQHRQPVKAPEKTTYASSGKVAPLTSNTQPDPAPSARKYSSLNSASPPFYPSGSSNKDIAVSHKRDVHAGNKNIRTTIVDESFSMKQSSALSQGKNIAESVGIDKLYINDSTAAVKPLNNTQMPTAASSVVNALQFSQSRGQGRGAAISGSMTYQSILPVNQVNRASASVQQLQGVQRSPAQNRIQPAAQAPSQQPSQRSVGASQASSPPKTGLSTSSYEPGDAETNSESGKSRTALVAKGKGSIQGSGRGSFIYSGGQVVGAAGNIGVGHGDQNFPTFLPVMQFGGQHPGGIGVPAVGMAFPGYVAQPQLGLGNSEMTWLPVLTGAAGALGATTYCSPYLAVDGAYHTRPSGPTSSTGSSSKESTINKTNNDWKPSQRPEHGNDDPGQRQKPRRYSEMDFKQPSTST